MKPVLCLLLLFCGLMVHAGKRDPFWPFDFQPGHEDPPPVLKPVPRPEETVQALTQAEIEKLAREESERIRDSLERRGTMNMAGNIYAYVQGRWVTIGDTITVTVGGQDYRLLISRLTTNDIVLEPHRIPPTSPNPGNRP